ncbi:uncharacterized protein FMAN_15485 [Fusarium mangiferae]|uniref:Uncharacterized protein n=1 Tax=Fusarium mangiferae TaxID=192010 RepID=A0A1L7UP65_FUSMA|nr:uncharacterized protein FMAN_15485 [Fusarium mangiferae]CVL09321.1 uncharacterized protein FMAN_15485 [Fusarium mangiferae]
MNPSGSKSLTYGFDSFFSQSSSPSLSMDPAPVNTPRMPSTAEQPPSDGIFDFGELGGEDLNALGSQTEYVDFLPLEQMSSSQPQQIFSDVDRQIDSGVRKLTTPDVATSSDLTSTFDTYPGYGSLRQDCRLDNDLDPGYQHPRASGAFDFGPRKEPPNVRRQCEHRHIDELSLLVRIMALEAHKKDAEIRIEELLKWKASQVARNVEMKNMMDEILEMLRNLETKPSLET